MLPVPAWLEDVYTLCAQERTDAAIDVLFDNINQMLIAQDYSRCDCALQGIDLYRLDTHLLVAVLAITFSAAPHLSFRVHLLRRITERLRELAPDRVDRLI